MGSATDARRVDSRRNISLRGNVRARVHEDVVPAAKTGSLAAAKMLCNERDVAIAGTRTSCMPDRKTAQAGGGRKTTHRNDYRRPVDPRAQRVVARLVASPSEHRTLEKLCRECGASKRTIQRLFREETKMTFSRWRQQLRLLHAMQRLASGEKVTAAALDAGYNGTSAFIAMFRKQLGKTLARYLESRAE